MECFDFDRRSITTGIQLESYYTPHQPALVNGLISPTRNVAKVNHGASVIEGFCDSTEDTPNVILNGTPNRVLNRHYTNHSGYTCHKIGKNFEFLLLEIASRTSGHLQAMEVSLFS